MIINAKEELSIHIARTGRTIMCANIVYLGETEPKQLTFLKKKHSYDDFLAFMDKLDFTYDNSYGTQYINGTVWYTDGTWSERNEYDGSEWWEFRIRPEIPEQLLAV